MYSCVAAIDSIQESGYLVLKWTIIETTATNTDLAYCAWVTVKIFIFDNVIIISPQKCFHYMINSSIMSP